MLYLIIASGCLCILSVIIHISNFKKQKELSFGRYMGNVLIGDQKMSRPREGAYDWLRFLATSMVLLVHTATDAEERMQGTEHGITWFITIAIITITYLCNFFFIEVSGALMLRPNDEPAWLFYAKRFVKVFVPMLAYYAFFMVLHKQLTFSGASIVNFLQNVSAGKNDFTPHLWVVFVILGCYLGTPLLRIAMKNITENQKKELLIVILILYVVKFIAVTTGWYSICVSSYMFDYTAVYIAGYLILNTDLKKAKPFIFISGGVLLLAIIVIEWIAGYKNDYINIYSPVIFCISLAITLFVKSKVKKQAPFLVRFIGNYSFSILMIHMAVMFTLFYEKLGWTLKLEEVLTPVPTCFIIFILSLIVSIILAIIIDKFIIYPITFGLQKLVGLLENTFYKKAKSK